MLLSQETEVSEENIIEPDEKSSNESKNSKNTVTKKKRIRPSRKKFYCSLFKIFCTKIIRSLNIITPKMKVGVCQNTLKML